MADIQEEQQRENEGLLESVRAASKEDKFLQLVMDSYIPKEYQVSIFMPNFSWARIWEYLYVCQSVCLCVLNTLGQPGDFKYDRI